MKPVRILRHSADEELGNLEVVLRQCGVPLEIIECFSPAWPQVAAAGFDPRQFGGLVVMGGHMNVDQTDRFGFLATEVEWLRAAVADELPVLGVCLGAQLLAKTLGQRVYANRVQEIGWYEIEMLDAAQDDPLFAGSRPRETVLQWHGDTFDLPAGAVQLARGATCENQAFRYGQAYGVQFHPEITAQMIDDWLVTSQMCGLAMREGRTDGDEIRGRATEGLAAMWPLSQRIFSRFATLSGARGNGTSAHSSPTA